MSGKSLLGGWGESAAAAFLREKGMKIEGAGYRSRFGEIDVIALDGDTLVFVEVKTRKSESFARPAESVTAKKLERLRATAAIYLAQKGADCPARFDVIEIIAPADLSKPPVKIRHLINVYTEMSR